jgi:hypothetical protein
MRFVHRLSAALHGAPTATAALLLGFLFRERGEVVSRLTEARRLGAAGTAAVREALTAQRALKAVWFQQVTHIPTGAASG